MHTTRSNASSWLRQLGAAILVLLLCPVSLRAQDSPEQSCDNVGQFPCGYQLRDVALQKVPPVFKFQARVSQAKLPIGEGTFNRVFVKLLRGTDVLCIEQFDSPVEVRDSVLNLEIGRNMSCELDEVIAENTNLAFQICLGSIDNCLKPIELGSTPYAVKASFASIAQQAGEANEAAVANYAVRVTADRDLHLRRSLGTGYFDFYTHAYGNAVPSNWYSDADAYEPYADGGFIAWTPVRDAEALNLHIGGKRQNPEALTDLYELVLRSQLTVMSGALRVAGVPVGADLGITVEQGGIHVTGASDIDGTLEVADHTVVQSGGLTVNAGGATVVAGGLSVQADGMNVVGTSTITGTLGVSEATTVAAGGIHVTGDSNVAGGLQVSGATDLGAALAVTGATTLSSTLSAAGLATFAAGMNGPAGGPLVVAGPLRVDGAATLGVAGAGQTTQVNGDLRVTGSVFSGGPVLGDDDFTRLDQTYVNVSDETADITLGGHLTLAADRNLSLSGGSATVRTPNLAAAPAGGSIALADHLLVAAGKYVRTPILAARSDAETLNVQSSLALQSGKSITLSGTGATLAAPRLAHPSSGSTIDVNDSLLLAASKSLRTPYLAARSDGETLEVSSDLRLAGGKYVRTPYLAARADSDTLNVQSSVAFAGGKTLTLGGSGAAVYTPKLGYSSAGGSDITVQDTLVLAAGKTVRTPYLSARADSDTIQVASSAAFASGKSITLGGTGAFLATPQLVHPAGGTIVSADALDIGSGSSAKSLRVYGTTYTNTLDNVSGSTITANANLTVNGTVTTDPKLVTFALREFDGGSGWCFGSLPVADWDCMVGGLRMLDGDIDEGGDGDILEAYTYPEAGGSRWCVRANFRTHNDNETVQIGVVCFRKGISSRTNDDWFVSP